MSSELKSSKKVSVTQDQSHTGKAAWQAPSFISRLFADKLSSEELAKRAEAIHAAYWCLTGREPTEAEASAAAQLLNERRSVDFLVAKLATSQEVRDRIANVAGQLPRHLRDSWTDSKAFIKANMPTAAGFLDPMTTLKYALSIAPVGGAALEFGVFSGRTLRVIAATRAGQPVYGFDSFKGLPEDWIEGFAAGAFATDEIPQVEGAQMVPGLFADTLPGFIASLNAPIDFVHIDCDLYSSTKCVLDHIGERLRVGTVMVFDEYLFYSGWREHEHKAWTEFVERSGIRFEYLAYTIDYQQVVLRVTAVA